MLRDPSGCFIFGDPFDVMAEHAIWMAVNKTLARAAVTMSYFRVKNMENVIVKEEFTTLYLLFFCAKTRITFSFFITWCALF